WMRCTLSRRPMLRYAASMAVVMSTPNTCAPFGRLLGKSSGTHAGIEQQPSSIVGVGPARRCTQCALGCRGRVERIELHGAKPVPLRAEAPGVRTPGNKSRNAGADRETDLAAITGQAPLENLAVDSHRGAQRQPLLARRTDDDFNRSRFHDHLDSRSSLAGTGGSGSGSAGSGVVSTGWWSGMRERTWLAP